MPTAATEPRPRALPLLAGIVVFAALAVAFTFGLLGLAVRINASDFYNADFIGPYLLIRSVLTASGSIFDWFYAPSNYLFPDHLIALIAYLTTPWRLVPVTAGGILLACYAVAMGTAVSFATETRFLRALVLSALWVAVMTFAGWLNVNTGTGGLLTPRLVNLYIHTGALACGPVFVALALAVAFLPPSRRRTGLLLTALAVDALLSFSDAIFVVWFVLPVVIVVLIHALAARSRTALVLGVLVIVVSVIVRVPDSMRKSIPYDFDVPRSLETFWNTVVLAPLHGDVVLTFLEATTLAMVVQAIAILVGLLRGGRLDPYRAMCLTFAGSAAAAWSAPVLVGLLQFPSLLRYSFALYIVTCTWWLLVALRHLPALRRPAPAVAAAVAFLAGTVAIGWTPAASDPPFMRSASTYTDCVLDNGLTAGLMDYWQAKPMIYLSDYRISAVAITATGSDRYDLAADRVWAFKTADQTASFNPNFILMKSLNADAIAERFGSPARRLPCADSEIWVYDAVLPVPPPLDLRL